MKVPIGIELKAKIRTYHVVSRIGEGGSAKVLEVSTESERYAIRLLKDSCHNLFRRSHFLKEVAFCMNSDHPNILKVLDFGEVSLFGATLPFMVMPLYADNLGAVSIDDPHVLIDGFIQILDGLESMHAQGLSHRDLTIQNVLVDKSHRQFVITDFGSTDFSSDGPRWPNSNLLNGNRFYAHNDFDTRMSEGIGQKKDIISLGILLHELFTRTPWYATNQPQISSIFPRFHYLDAIVHALVGGVATLSEVRQRILSSIESVSLI